MTNRDDFDIICFGSCYSLWGTIELNESRCFLQYRMPHDGMFDDRHGFRISMPRPMEFNATDRRYPSLAAGHRGVKGARHRDNVRLASPRDPSE